MIKPSRVACPHCLAPVASPCMSQPGPGVKKLFVAAPLVFSEFHPSRLAAALKADGVSEAGISARVSAHLAAAAGKYRQAPGCAAAWDCAPGIGTTGGAPGVSD